MAGVESSKRDLVVRPGQKNALGTVLAVRLSPELGLDKARPRGFGVEPPPRDKLQCACDRRFAQAIAWSGASRGCRVGAAVTRRAPHRPGRARLAHPVLR